MCDAVEPPNNKICGFFFVDRFTGCTYHNCCIPELAQQWDYNALACIFSHLLSVQRLRRRWRFSCSEAVVKSKFGRSAHLHYRVTFKQRATQKGVANKVLEVQEDWLRSAVFNITYPARSTRSFSSLEGNVCAAEIVQNTQDIRLPEVFAYFVTSTAPFLVDSL